ncbi:MDR family MFS transporter [Streptomyces sp. NPDC007896]|uniref:MDR family MFS transporter n=1 Tax=Streptomyces sp. NPDC007896 TaxID=3364784 RepID=UPI0036EB9F10
MTPSSVLARALPGAARALPAAFWWIWLSILVNWTGSFASPVLAVYLTLERGYSPYHTGLVVSLIGLGGILGTTWGGFAADRIGRRTTLVLAHCWTAACMVLVGVCASPAALACAALALGVGQTAARPAMQAALTDVVAPEDRQRAFALNYWALNLGVAVSGVLAGLLVAHGYLVVFLADAAATLLCAVVVLAKVPETRSAPGSAHGVSPARPGQEGGDPGTSRPVLRDRRFVAFVLVTLVFATVYQQIRTSLPVTMSQDGYAPSSYSLLYGLNALLVIVLQIPLTMLVRGRSRSAVLTASGLLMGAGLGLTALAVGPAAYAGCVVVWTLGEMLQAPAGIAAVSDRAPEQQRGRYQGLYGTAWSAAAFLAPAGAGWVLDHGGATTLWMACAAGGLLSAIGYAWTTGPDHQLPHAEKPSDVRAGKETPFPGSVRAPADGSAEHTRRS